MKIHKISLWIAITLAIIANISYAILTLQGLTTHEPNRVTWFILAVLDWTIGLALAKDAFQKELAWMPITMAICTTLVWVTTLIHGKNEIPWIDGVTIVIVAIGWIAWRLSHKALIGLFFALTAYVVAYAPIIANPGKENYIPWSIGAVANLFYLGAIEFQNWKLQKYQTWITSVVFAATAWIVLYFVLFR